MRAMTPCNAKALIKSSTEAGSVVFTETISESRTVLVSYSTLNASIDAVSAGSPYTHKPIFTVKFQQNDAAKTDVFEVPGARWGGQADLNRTPTVFIEIPGRGVLFENGLHVRIELSGGKAGKLSLIGVNLIYA